MTEPSRSRPAPTHPVWWIIAVSLAVIAVNLTMRDRELLPSAVAQSVHGAGARGIFAFTGQMGPNSYGVYVVDTDSGTIWCYEVVNSQGGKKLRLASARSWIFDRYLKNYNVDGPTEADVKEMVNQERGGPARDGFPGQP